MDEFLLMGRWAFAYDTVLFLLGGLYGIRDRVVRPFDPCGFARIAFYLYDVFQF